MPKVLELYEKLKPKLGEEEVRALLEFVETSVEQRAATNWDLERTESTPKEEIHPVESTLRGEIRNVKVDPPKWSFASWVGAVAVLSGIMFTLLRAVGPG